MPHLIQETPSPPLWHISLLGGICLRRADSAPCGEGTSRFRSNKTAALLAYLAYHVGRRHPREVLADIFWPDHAPDAARHSLRTALSSLRAQLEPPGVAAPGSVLLADRSSVTLSAALVQTDVGEIRRLLEAAYRTTDPEARRQRLTAALDRFPNGGTSSIALLPGHYEEWVAGAQADLAGRFTDALDRLLRLADGEDRERYAARYASRAAALAGGGGPGSVREGETRYRGPRPPREHTPRLAAAESDVGVWPTGPHLPVPLTRFFGRVAELRDLVGLLEAHGDDPAAPRLVTVVGPGGIGKTRLALEGVRQCAGLTPRLFFVDLTPLEEGASVRRVAEALRQVVAPTADGGVDTGTALAAALTAPAGEGALAILDNAEHVVDAVAELVGALLARVPRLRCLVTSRVPLGLAGERLFPLGPLPSDPARAEDGLTSTVAADLYLDRARTVRPDLPLSSRNVSAATELARRLDGIPLALELAAARAQVLTPAQTLDQIERRFAVLVSRSRSLPSRHQALHACIDWSYRALPADTRRFFACLPCFRGGWTLDAAAAVWGGVAGGAPDEPDELAALDHLTELARHSLLTIEDGPTPGAVRRYGMLETIRAFAAGRASEEIGTAGRDAAARAHAAYCLDLTAHGAAGDLDRLEAEHDNLRAALDWAERKDPVLAMRLAGALLPFWDVRGHWAEASERSERLLADYPLPGEKATAGERIARAATLVVRGTMGLNLASAAGGGDADAVQNAETALEEAAQLYRAAGDPAGEVVALSRLARAAQARGELDAGLERARAALAAAEDLGDPRRTSNAQALVGTAHYLRGEHAEAREAFERVLIGKRAAGDDNGTANALFNLANVAEAQGDGAAERSLRAESLALYRGRGNKHGMASALWALGLARVDAGDYDGALADLEEAVALRRELKAPAGIAHALAGLAYALSSVSENASATESPCLEALDLLRNGDGIYRDPPTAAWCLETFAILRHKAGERGRASELAREAAILRRGGPHLRRTRERLSAAGLLTPRDSA